MDKRGSDNELLQLTDLNAEYWFRVDHPESGEVANLYAEAGQMVFGAFSLDGRSAIREFFVKRNACVPQRITRHISTNVRIHPLGADMVRIHSIVSVFAGIGSLPLDVCNPSAILDFEDICERHGQGWMYRQRSGSAIFIGPGAATFLTNQLAVGHPLRTESS